MLAASTALGAAGGPAYVAAEVAHLDTPPLLTDAVARCAECGATQVVVVPMFLAPGAHAQADVPRLVAAASAAFPALELSTTDFIGRHSGLPNAILELARAQWR